MKKIFLAIAMLVMAANMASAAKSGDLFGYFNYSMMPIQTTGLQNIALSDWQTFGLGASEGRLSLPLYSEAHYDNYAPGFTLGASYFASDNFSLLFEGSGFYTKNNSVLWNFNVGFEFRFVNTNGFYIGLSPRAGLSYYTIDFGKVQQITGKKFPVYASEGTIYDGAELSAEIFGGTAQALVTMGYALSDAVELNAGFGYIVGFLGELVVTAKNPDSDTKIEFQKDSKALVKNDGSSTQAGIDPQLKVDGFIFNIGLSFKF